MLRPAPLVRAALAAAALTAALLPGSGAAPVPTVAADPLVPVAARTITIGPGADVNAAMAGLRAGDVLKLKPGTYDTGYIGPPIAKGTAAAPIVMTAADPARPPLILGGLRLNSPFHWKVTHLRIRTDVQDRAALYIDGGAGWSVRHNELTGARYTDAYANVAVKGTGGYPRGFDISDNCIHDAGRSPRERTDHNIYLAFQGSPKTWGVVTRNTIFGHPNGVGIKIGDGGVTGALGPWNVNVTYNSIGDGGRQILLHGDVRGNKMVGNLLVRSLTPYTNQKWTTAVWMNNVVTRTNVLSHTYVYSATKVVYDPKGKLVLGKDNGRRPDPVLKPFTSCSGFKPAYAKAKPYGRYASGAFPAW